MAQLIGTESIRFNGTKLNMKSGGFGSPVEWHQDWAFYPHSNDDLLAVGVAIDEMSRENGCLMVVPGSHKGRIYDHHQDGHFAGAVTESDFDDSSAGVDRIGSWRYIDPSRPYSARFIAEFVDESAPAIVVHVLFRRFLFACSGTRTAPGLGRLQGDLPARRTNAEHSHREVSRAAAVTGSCEIRIDLRDSDSLEGIDFQELRMA